MYDHIVIAVDGSEESMRATRRGLALARAFDATVDVLTVVERKALRLTRAKNEEQRLRERGQRILADAEDLAADLDYPVTTVLREGSPDAEISAYADEQDADLIIVGRQGMTGLGKRLLGGVTEHVIYRTDLPVFVVPGETADTNGEYERLLLTTDGSENAATATPHAGAVAAQYGAAVHVLNVVDLQSAGGLFDAGGLEREFIERLETQGREAVDRTAADLTERAPDVPVETATERTRADAGAAAGIREYAADHDIDLVVMASHGRSDLGRQLLGSVTATVLRTADVPVLVVKRA
jgi:nucleotide-binding universal stress UspA family protein